MSKIKDSIDNYFSESANVISSLSSELKSIKDIAIAIHENNLNGGWEQVYHNICGQFPEKEILIYGICGFLLVNDVIFLLSCLFL